MRPGLRSWPSAATAFATVAVLTVLGNAQDAGNKPPKTYHALMALGAKQCRDSEYFSEDNLDKIARYCLLISEEQDCLQYCINEALGLQTKATWNKTAVSAILEPTLREFYPPDTSDKDIYLDVKYCVEKSYLPPGAELIFTDYCEVAEYVHFCIREHFLEDKKIDCYPDY